MMKATERGRELEQLNLLERLLDEQKRTNDLLGALVQMRSAELAAQGYAPHPLAG
jgi:hypothetical protein